MAFWGSLVFFGGDMGGLTPLVWDSMEGANKDILSDTLQCQIRHVIDVLG